MHAAAALSSSSRAMGTKAIGPRRRRLAQSTGEVSDSGYTKLAISSPGPVYTVDTAGGSRDDCQVGDAPDRGFRVPETLPNLGSKLVQLACTLQGLLVHAGERIKSLVSPTCQL